MGDSAVDPRVETVEPCELLDVAAASSTLGDLGDPIELEGGAACGVEATDGARVALAVVRSDGTPFLTTEQDERAEAVDNPVGGRWVVEAPVPGSDLLVVDIGTFAELVVEISYRNGSENDRRAVAVAVASAAIDRFEHPEGR